MRVSGIHSELVLDVNIFLSTICCHLKNKGKVSKLGVWHSYIPSEKNKKDRISLETNLLSRQKNDSFLFNVLRGDNLQHYHFKTTFKAKAVDWQGWIPAASSKGRVSWKKRFGLVSLFKGIPHFMGYVIQKPSLQNSSDIIQPVAGDKRLKTSYVVCMVAPSWYYPFRDW